MPTGKGLDDAVRRGHAIGCTAVQVFTSSPQQWKAKPITDEQAEALQLALTETGIGKAIISHDSYLINLAAPDELKREMSMNGLISELGRCHHLGIPLVVSHMGAHMGQGEEIGLEMVIEGAKVVLDTAPGDSMLLMETTAGQGSSLGYKFEHWAYVLEKVNHPRLGICLDTCHMFVAGYDLSTPEGYADVMNQLDKTIGIKNVKCIHVNDSKKALGSRVDRHEHIGEGLIGEACFHCLMNDERFNLIPKTVETPDAETCHEKNVKKLWELWEHS